MENREISINNFNKAKEEFLIEFQRETQDLSEKWKGLDLKKQENKQIFDREKVI